MLMGPMPIKRLNHEIIIMFLQTNKVFKCCFETKLERHQQLIIADPVTHLHVSLPRMLYI